MSSPSLTVSLNINWRFGYFPEAEQDEDCAGEFYDESGMICVSLPHTWSTYETTGDIHPFIMSPSETDDPYWWNGWGIYRKRFYVNSGLADKKTFAEFGGVQKYCKVWLNGNLIGEHKGGYNSFCFDITDFIHTGGNVLCVAVSNRRNDIFGGIPPKAAGNFNTYGGIYRGVRIVVKERIYIPFQGSHEHEGGTHITTSGVETGEAIVHIKTYIKNDTRAPVTASVAQRVYDADGSQTAFGCCEALLGTDGINCVEQDIKIEAPLLWSPEHPYLYTVQTSVMAGGTVTDEITRPLGFRWFYWNYGDNRLYLNGKKTMIHGTNRHQEYPWLGDAIPTWIHAADLEDIRFNLGHNFIRTCHYTQDSMVYDLCDRYGILVCEEVPNIKNQSFDRDVQRQQVKEMIRRDRNHPSIIIWSMGNETDSPAKEAWALEEDRARIIHFRHALGEGACASHTHEQLQMENLLQCTIRGWYNGDVRALEPGDGQHACHEEHQHNGALKPAAVLENGVETHIERAIEMNGVMWLYADHGADREYKDCPLLHVNPKGWTDAYRIPKQIYYLWQAYYGNREKPYIHEYDWTRRYIGQERDITVNARCDTVKLFVGGMPAGEGRTAPGHTVVFRDVAVSDTELQAVGVCNGRETAHVLPMASQPASVALTASHNFLTANRADICLVTARIADKNGNTVTGSFLPVTWSVYGPGSLVGPPEYTTDRDKQGEPSGTMYTDTPAVMPIRAGFGEGELIVTATSPGLATGRITIDIIAQAPPDISVIDPDIYGAFTQLRVARREYGHMHADGAGDQNTPLEIKKD